MIIYPLPPEEFDDKTLKKQIKAIAQVLCNVHHKFVIKKYENMDVQEFFQSCGVEAPLKDHRKIPLAFCADKFREYSQWASTCRANYLKLVDMGMACCEEYKYRLSEPLINMYGDAGKIKHYKLQPVIEWARDNVPNLTNYVGVKAGDKLGNFTVPRSGKGYSPSHSTPFPLVMPQLYYCYTIPKKEIEGKSFELELRWLDIEESYRNYYCAKLKKKQECSNCEGTGYVYINGNCEDQCYKCDSTGIILPKWTRREKPDWLQGEA